MQLSRPIFKIPFKCNVVCACQDSVDTFFFSALVITNTEHNTRNQTCRVWAFGKFSTELYIHKRTPNTSARATGFVHQSTFSVGCLKLGWFLCFGKCVFVSNEVLLIVYHLHQQRTAGTCGNLFTIQQILLSYFESVSTWARVEICFQFLVVLEVFYLDFVVVHRHFFSAHTWALKYQKCL